MDVERLKRVIATWEKFRKEEKVVPSDWKDFEEEIAKCFETEEDYENYKSGKYFTDGTSWT